MAEQIDKMVGLKAGEKTRSYREFVFSVIIPVITQIHDTIQVKFSVKKQTGNNVAMIVDQCQITDKLGRTYQAKPKDVILLQEPLKSMLP